jgi:hypothetical protein
VNLVRPSKESFNVISSFELPQKGRGFHWAHPVVCDGCLFLRYENNLFVYKIK